MTKCFNCSGTGKVCLVCDKNRYACLCIRGHNWLAKCLVCAGRGNVPVPLQPGGLSPTDSDTGGGGGGI